MDNSTSDNSIKSGIQGIQVNVPDPDKSSYEMRKDGSLESGVVDKNGKSIILPNTLGDLKYIIQDILAGDKSALERPEFKSLQFDKVEKALGWLAKSNNMTDTMKSGLLTDGWKLTFREKPATAEEFLTHKYIGDQASTLHPWIHDTFVKFFDPLAPYRNLILSSCIGTGKSTITALCNLYIAYLFALMSAPYKYYGYAPSSPFTIVFGGYSQKKAYQLLMNPILNILRQSDYFKQCRTMDDMIKANKEFTNASGVPNVYWTTAAKTACISLSNNLNFNIVSSSGDIIGQNIIMGSCTEISFWRDEGGWSDDRIYEFFTNLQGRIDNRMHNNRISGFILDSSPNTMDSAIDKWIWEEAPKDPKNYIFKGATWKYFKNNFVGCYDDFGEIKHDWKICFPMYKGGNGKLPRPVESENDLQQFDPIDIIWCPREESNGGVSMYNKAKTTPEKFLKDNCGIPAGTSDRIFYNPETIETVFDNNLRNIMTQITAPAEEEPEHLIWNQIKETFFNRIVDKYYFYYEPLIPRVISVDQAYAGDATCIAMTHVERDPTKIDKETGDALKVYVTDFTIVIVPKGGIINLDAIKFFIADLIKLGNLKIAHVSYDRFQSEPSRQFLKRLGVGVEYVSVDRVNDPYLTYIDYIFHGRYFCGKNVYVKNNLKSLHMSKRKSGTMKIDHTNGDVISDGNGNWETDMRGINAKDTADAICASVDLLNKYSNEYMPYNSWSPESDKSHDYDTMKKKTNDFLKKQGFEV